MALFSATIGLASLRIAHRFGASITITIFLAFRFAVNIFLEAMQMPVIPEFPIWLPALILIGVFMDTIQERKSNSKR